MKRLLRPLLFVVIGMVLAVPLMHVGYQAMVVTSTPEFCGSCHEIAPAVRAWRASTHVNNQRGIVADCMDCHLPPPENTLQFFAMKTYHGMKDVTFHVLEGVEGYDKEEARQGVYDEVTNDTCLRCHENITAMPHSRGAMLAHRAVLNPPPNGAEKTCLDCHYDLVHQPRTALQYSHLRELPYQAKGLRTLSVRRAVTDS